MKIPAVFVYKEIAHFTDVRTFFIMTAKEMEVAVMKRKNYQVILRLSMEEAKLAVSAMIDFRNRCLAQGKPTEDLDELILKLCKA